MRARRERMQTRIDAQLKTKLQAFAASRGISMSDVVEVALREYLNPEDYKTVSIEYLARIERQHQRVLERLEMALETIGKFALVWFTNTPEMEGDALRRARAQRGMARYTKFLDKIAVSMSEDSVRQAFESRIADEDNFDF